MFSNKTELGRASQIAELEAELRRLRTKPVGKQAAGSQNARSARANVRGCRGRVRRQQRANTAVLAPGHVTNTRKGSIYNTILRVLASLGKLELHGHFFQQFERSRTPESARKLLETIGVYSVELAKTLFSDPLYKDHQRHRTLNLKNRAARGDRKARAILRDPAISDGHGHWRGDLNEATNILYGARHPRQWARGKNVGIMRKANLHFDRNYRGTQEVVYMYPRKFHRLFTAARALAGA